LTEFTLQEATEIQAVAERLNRHGFDLQRTGSRVLPKLERIASFLQTPTVAASLPWVLRRVFGQPLKRRH
jgi:hypothetical protein